LFPSPLTMEVPRRQLFPSPWPHHRWTDLAYLISTSMVMYHALGLGWICLGVAKSCIKYATICKLTRSSS